MANRLLAQFLSLSFLWDCLGHLCVSRARLHAEKPIRFRSFSHVVPFNPISTVWFSCFTLFSIPFFCMSFAFVGTFNIYICAFWRICACDANVYIEWKKKSVILFPFLGSFFPSSATITCVAHFSFYLSLAFCPSPLLLPALLVPFVFLSTGESRFIFALHVVRNDAKMHSVKKFQCLPRNVLTQTHSLHISFRILNTKHTGRIMLEIYVCKLPFRKPFDFTRMLMFQVDKNMQHFHSTVFNFRVNGKEKKTHAHTERMQ